MSRPEDPPNDRLNGWKEIAAFLGKGVRTVQRWEREYGLPVHRIGREGGEIVFASRGELDGWLREHELRTRRQDQARRSGAETSVVEPLNAVRAPMAVVPESVHVAAATPADSERGWSTRARTWLLRTAAVAIIALTGAFIWLEALPQPASWKADRDKLYVYNRLGWELWHKSFHRGLEDQLRNPRMSQFGGQLTLADIDGDGSVEVLLATAPPDRNPDQTAFYIFNSDGTPRRVIRPDQRLTYGDSSSELLAAGPPWVPTHIWVLGHSVFVEFIHLQDFPTLLLELDAQGKPNHEYWSDGYIETLARLRWQDHDTLFVGGTNNETKGGSLAIFKSGHAQGFAPSLDPKYLCHGCPDGVPSEVVVFPRRCIAKRSDSDGNATVDEIRVEDERRIHVQVGEGPMNADGWPVAGVLYTLGPDLTVIQAEKTTGLIKMHADLRRQRELDHDYGLQDEHEFFSVRRWVVKEWVGLPVASGVRVSLGLAADQGKSR